MLKMNIGNNIKKYRLLANMSQSDLGKRLNVSNRTISSWESNRTEPNMGTIEQLCEILNCKKSELIGMAAQGVPKYDSTIMEIIALLDKMTPEQQQSVLNFMRSFVN